MRIIIILTILSALTATSDAATNTAVIYGKISKPISEKIYLYQQGFYDNRRVCIDSTDVATDGLFQFKFTPNPTEEYDLFLGLEKKYVGLSLIPGDSIVFRYHPTSKELVIEYDKLKANTIYRSFCEKISYLSGYEKVSETNEQELFANLDSLELEIKAFIKDSLQYFSEHKVLKEYIEASQVANRIVSIFWYDFSRRQLYGDSAQESFDLQGHINLDLKPFVGMTRPGFFYPAVSILLDLMTSKSKHSGMTNEEIYELSFLIAKDSFPGVFSDLATMYAVNAISNIETGPEYLPLLRKQLNSFATRYKREEYFQYFSDLLDKKESLMPGKIAPEFRLLSFDSTIVGLHQFRNKVIYIAFWGTWWKPRREELLYLEDLSKKFKKKDEVVFISIAMEGVPFSVWKKYVTLNKLSGIQLYTQGQLNSPVAHSYNIISLPRYVLLNKNSIIVNSNELPPSDDGVEQHIRALLK